MSIHLNFANIKPIISITKTKDKWSVASYYSNGLSKAISPTYDTSELAEVAAQGFARNYSTIYVSPGKSFISVLSEPRGYTPVLVHYNGHLTRLNGSYPAFEFAKFTGILLTEHSNIPFNPYFFINPDPIIPLEFFL
ncbi:MAG: hypothetical protein VX777_04160 [Chlamydiota bacterium]|nr:hypothetical protein [Chlamydiota bacterium]